MATAAQIDAAVQKLLREGDAQLVYGFACYQSNRVTLGQTAGVIPKLVELVCRGIGKQKFALCALEHLTHHTLVEAQDAIADAHDGAIFAWLVGVQDHGGPNQKQQLLTQLTSNHPVNHARLATARGDLKPLVDLIKTSVASGNSTAMVKAASEVCTMAKPEQLAAFSQLGGVAALEMVINWMPNVWDEQTFQAQDYALTALTKFQGRKNFRESRKALIRALEQSTTGDLISVARKCRELYKLAVSSEIEALAIVEDGGVPALVAVLQREVLDGKDGRHVSQGLWGYAAQLLAILVKQDASAIAHILEQNAVEPLLLLSCSRSISCKDAAIDVLYKCIQDPIHAGVVVRVRGIAFLLELLQLQVVNGIETSTPVVAILEAQLLTSKANQLVFVNCDGAVEMLVTLCNSQTPAIRGSAETLVQNLSATIQPLLGLLKTGTTVDVSHRIAIVSALEIWSRAPKNHEEFQLHGGLERMARLLVQSGHDESTQATAARVLANFSSGNATNSTLIAQGNTLPVLVKLLKTTSNEKLKTSVAMALRNLASDAHNQAVIGALDVIPHVVEMVRNDALPKQRLVAVALLGNLGRLPANQKRIIAHGGIAVLLAAIRGFTTPIQLETVAMALWALIKDNPESQKMLVTSALTDASGVHAIKAAVEQHADKMPWATRLLTALDAAID